MKINSFYFCNRLSQTNQSHKLLIRIMLSAILLFSFGYSYAQSCLTDTLTISTGWDPKANGGTGGLIAGGNPGDPAVADPYWTVTAVNPQVNVAAGGTYTISTSHADIVAAYGTWITSPVSNWISCMNSSVYNTDGLGTEYYNMTLARCFRICKDDSIRIHLKIADDNYASLTIDGQPTSFNQAVGLGSWTIFNTFDTTIWMAAGTHCLSFVVNDYNNINGPNPTGLNVAGKVISATSTNSIVSESTSACDTYACSQTVTTDTCSDICYWRVTGNNIYNGNNIFGTISNDNVNIITNNTPMGIFTNDGLFGLHTPASATTARLHVECVGHWKDGSGKSDVRFQDLQHNPKGDILVIDPATGYVFDSKQLIGTGGGITNACGGYGIVPRTIDPFGDLDCGQIFDNGAGSVGINTTGPFTYVWSGGLTGSTLPPTSGTVTLDVNGVVRGLAYIATSDERLKTNINAITDPFRIINGLMGKTYNWNQSVISQTHADNGLQYGFIAQDVAKVIPEAVVVDSAGKYGINYNSFIPVLTEGEKELYIMYQQQKTANEKLQSQVDELTQKLDELANCCANNSNLGVTDKDVSTNSGDILYQNTPNPFNKETVIGYYISKMAGNAAIVISDLNGKEISRYQINAIGNGSISVKAQNMIPGIYLYTLVVDGNIIDSKKMVIGG